jgi:hypothetical protein
VFTEDITAFFSMQGFAEQCTVQGNTVAAIFNSSTEVVLGNAIVMAPSLELPASAVPAAAEGGACTVRGVAYTIRAVNHLPPDGAVWQLVLARA